MNKIKVIFLDIDGVLRPVTGEAFSKKCIAKLNQLIEQTESKIVISSTWRQQGIDYVKEFLYKNGLVGDIIDITPILGVSRIWSKFEKYEKIKVPRGLEIKQWLVDYTNMDQYVESYAIIDDSGDMFLSQLDHYVNVEQTKGFDNKCLKDAISILNIVDIPTF